MRFTLPLLLTVGACAGANPPELGGTCQSDSLAQFIGQPVTGQLSTDMLRASGARFIRWVPLGGVVTMDFSPVRLTVQLDGANRVQSANCG
jgi:hypothetical protein